MQEFARKIIAFSSQKEGNVKINRNDKIKLIDGNYMYELDYYGIIYLS